MDDIIFNIILFKNLNTNKRLIMDEKLNNIKTYFELKRMSHPNLIKIWSEYIKIKEKKFNNDMQRCLNMLDKIDNFNDLTMEEILLTSSILNIVSDNNT